jgi:hypothetical protein
MIKHEWRNTLSAEEAVELDALLQRAADYDAEPAYSTITFSDIERAMSDSSRKTCHLLIWMLPHAVAMDQPPVPERIAGIVRLAFRDESSAEASVVIDPNLRSIGIMTLLLEQLGLDTDADEGWAGTGARRITSWAQGSHPATGRLSNRFLIPRTKRVWKLICPVRSAEAAAAPVLEPADDGALNEVSWAAEFLRTGRVLVLREGSRILGGVELDTRITTSLEFGACATIRRIAAAPHVDAVTRRRLLQGAIAIAHDAGRTGVIIHVDSADAAFVNACRLSGFQHDRTDVRYELGGQRA